MSDLTENKFTLAAAVLGIAALVLVVLLLVFVYS